MTKKWSSIFLCTPFLGILFLHSLLLSQCNYFGSSHSNSLLPIVVLFIRPPYVCNLALLYLFYCITTNGYQPTPVF